MSALRWTPPWYRGFGWVVYGAFAGSLMTPLFGDIQWWWGLLPGAAVGCINWWWCWNDWAEFGPDWDGGI